MSQTEEPAIGKSIVVDRASLGAFLHSRLTFTAILSGVLLITLFQIVFISKQGLVGGQIALLNALFGSLVYLVLCFLVSSIFLLLASAENGKRKDQGRRSELEAVDSAVRDLGRVVLLGSSPSLMG